MKPSALALALLLATVNASGAQQWGSSPGPGEVRLGPVAENEYYGIFIACSTQDGAVRLSLDGRTGPYESGSRLNVTLSVDGQPFPLAMVVTASEVGPAYSFDTVVEPGAFEPILLALAKGKTARIETPRDAYAVALSGSGKAIAEFRKSCPSL